MARQEFENQTVISAVTNKTIVVITGESSFSLAPAVYERITILSPAKSVSRLFNMRLSWDIETVAISGLKELYIDQQVDQTTGIGLFKFTGNWNNLVQYDKGEWQNITSSSPSDIGAMSSQIQAGRFDEFKGIQMVFKHGLNVNASAKRSWTLFVEREVVAR